MFVVQLRIKKNGRKWTHTFVTMDDLLEYLRDKDGWQTCRIRMKVRKEILAED